MGKPNSYILGEIMRSVYHVASRRTTQSFAAKVIGSIIKTLEQRYPFLKYVKINEIGELPEDEAVSISAEIDKIDQELVGKSIEAIIRIVYMDIIGKAGLFFIAELKRRAGDELISELNRYGVDLAGLQIEQHYLYRSRERKRRQAGKSPAGEVSLLGYTWKNVSSWKYDSNKKTCILYNKEGDILDNLNLDSIIENYIKSLSEDAGDIPDEIKEKTNFTNKDLELLNMLRSRDMDAETAMNLLHISKDEFENMIKKLLENELLQYTSYNVIELTEIGISFLYEKEKKENDEKNKISKEIS